MGFGFGSWVKGLGSRLGALASKAFRLLGSRPILRFAVYLTLSMILSMSLAQPIHAETGSGIAKLAGDLTGQLKDFGMLLGALAGIMLGVGLAGKFLPWGSFQMKQSFGRCFDYAILLGALLALGTFLIYFAGDIAVTVAGKGGITEPSGPWAPPSSPSG